MIPNETHGGQERGELNGRVEKALARGQRISRQPWNAWNRHGRFVGVYRTKREALAAAQADERPARGRTT